jgi:hypothetical protein
VKASSPWSRTWVHLFSLPAVPSCMTARCGVARSRICRAATRWIGAPCCFRVFLSGFHGCVSCSQCVNQGYYCSPDPDGPDGLLTGHSGADVVMEELRQICVFQQANMTVATDNAIRYWNYVNLWYNQCMDVEDWVSCSASQQLAAGLDPNWTLNCMIESNNTGNYTNTLLQQELHLREDYLILALPTFVVNEVVMRGQPTPHLLFNSICNGFASKAPAFCECTVVSDDVSCAGGVPLALPP